MTWVESGPGGLYCTSSSRVNILWRRLHSPASLAIILYISALSLSLYCLVLLYYLFILPFNTPLPHFTFSWKIFVSMKKTKHQSELLIVRENVYLVQVCFRNAVLLEYKMHIEMQLRCIHQITT